MSQQVLTANRLRDGVVVFLDEDGGWTEQIAAARVAADKADGDALVKAGEARAGEVITPYLIDVALKAEGPWPLRYRERIRAFGPSIHPEFAK